MTKTGQQIEDDIYELLNNSSLPSVINGTVYKFGMRPKDSTLEDAIVKFVTGLNGDIQEGVVVVNIYIPDFDAYGDGVMRKDITRCTELEITANKWVETIIDKSIDYLFELQHTIYTEPEYEIDQHFIAIKLKYKLVTI